MSGLYGQGLNINPHLATFLHSTCIPIWQVVSEPFEYLNRSDDLELLLCVKKDSALYPQLTLEGPFLENLQMDFLIAGWKWPQLDKGGVTVAKKGR